MKTNIIYLHTQPITITRKRIKNLYLRVYPDGRIVISAPRRLSDKAIQEFVNSKSDWIQAQLEKMLSRQNEVSQREFTYSTGETHYLWGQPCALIVEETTGRSSVTLGRTNISPDGDTLAEEVAEKTQASDFNIHLRTSPNATPEQRKHLLDEFYRAQLKAVVPTLMSKYIAIVGKSPKEWRIRSMKTKWGTCNVVDRRIWLSLNLAKKDPRCLEYVIAHELTHLHEPNHGKAFWMRMDDYFPEWREVRKLLK